jgi:hypothetical protein
MKPALDTYDDMPKYMRKYLQNYGWHFNKALCNYATSLMTKNGKKLEPLTKEYVDKAIAAIDIPEPEVDLSDYYTKTETDRYFATIGYVDEAIENIDLSSVDLSNYYTKSEIDALIPNYEPSEGVDF